VDPKQLIGDKPGVLIRGMSFLDYEKLPAINWSRLKPYLKSAAHGKAAERESDDADFLDYGQALHRAVLEPGLFDQEFGTIPEDAPTKRSNEGKAWWQAFEAANVGRTMLKPETLVAVRRGAEAVYAHPRMAAMLNATGSQREVVALAMDPEFGIYRKARLDLLSSWQGESFIVDLKSAFDASNYGMSRAMNTNAYHAQLSFYRQTLNYVAPYDRRAALFAVEKDPTIAVAYDVDEATLEVGEQDVVKAMRTFIESDAAQRWPGYPDGMLSLPAWRLKER